MTGDVEFWNYADTAVAGISNEFANFRLCVKEAVGGFALQLGELLALHAEALVVGEVPVEDVEVNGFHSVNGAAKRINRHEVAADVDHEAAPGESGFVLDPDGGSGEACRSGLYQM